MFKPATSIHDSPLPAAKHTLDCLVERRDFGAVTQSVASFPSGRRIAFDQPIRPSSNRASGKTIGITAVVAKIVQPVDWHGDPTESFSFDRSEEFARVTPPT